MKSDKKRSIKFKVIISVILFLFAAIQFVPAEKTNPEVIGEASFPSELKEVIKRSCYDCHSNETLWPWYSHVAPVSWLLVKDVNEGREHLNFSEWDKIESAKKGKILEEIWEEVSEDKMPLGIYTLMHNNAKLSSDEKQIIKDWVFNQKRLWN